MTEQSLANFCDILSDEICDSQPMSLSSYTTPPPEITLQNSRPPKYTGQKGIFRSVEEIDSKYRHVFTYPYFNLVQSKVIDDALYSNKSIVVSAPTGSGKTVVFEMAIVQLLMELENKQYMGDFKIIYVAPIKAVCTERITEWHSKFANLGHLCILVTGDTDVEFPQLQPYRIIITTPEKWDMLTRRWKDHRNLVEVVKLFLIDEVHILNDEIRGPVLEAVVSRMKTIETSAQSAHRIEKVQAEFQGLNMQYPETPPRIRFVAVSATVSNPEDVAAWLGTKEMPAAYFKFGDECRPVKLKRVVEGYPFSNGTSVFKFDIILNYKLWPIIQKYHNGKPTLIFCNTRKSVIMTAETLSREVTVNFGPELKASLTVLAASIKNKKVQSLILCGVGCHHAGLLYEERMNIEQAFRNRELPILITTTTLDMISTYDDKTRHVSDLMRWISPKKTFENRALIHINSRQAICHVNLEVGFTIGEESNLKLIMAVAMGVNLPAHLVIIKNTQYYVNGAYQEYSISTVLQMVGRAGRPQFDTEATAVIMTRLQDKARYQSLVEGSEPLQSYLHKRLPENLNSEAASGTVGDVAQCVQWLNSTFLSVRAMRDPKRYLGLPRSAPEHLICKKLEELCVKAMNGLSTAGLISMDEACCIQTTDAGRLMSIYYLDLETMKLIMKLEGTESLERLLWLICESHELADMHLRVDERRCLNALNRNNAATTIRFPMKGKINSRPMKLNCIIQAVLGCLSIPDPSLNQEAMKIMRIAERICKCLVSYVTRPNLISENPKFFSTVLNSLILAKCISAHLWENSQYVSRQLKGIGPTFSTLLASAGKINFMMLEESHPRDLERIMNKGPPAGNVIRKQIGLLPKYNLSMTPVNEMIVKIQLSLLNQAHLSENMEDLTAGANHKCYIIVGDSENYILHFNTFKDSDLIRVYDGCMSFNVTRERNNEHKIVAYCISSTFVGIDEKSEYIFVDLNPRIENITINNYHRALETSEKENRVIQTSVTDYFKERKRKMSNIIETRPIAKKSRHNKLINSFKDLKDSFGMTTEKIKMDSNKKTEILQNLIHNSTNTGSHFVDSSCSTITTNLTSNHQNKNQTLEDIFSNGPPFHSDNEDDFVDDDQVVSILNEIENEIKNKNTNNCIPVDKRKTSAQHKQLPDFYKLDAVTYNLYAGPHQNINIIKKNKNNYTFLHSLEKKNNVNEENDTEIMNENGFSEAVKCNLQKYLQQTKDTNNTKNSILEVIKSPRQMDKLKSTNELSNKEHVFLGNCNKFDNNLSNPLVKTVLERPIENNSQKPEINVHEFLEINKGMTASARTKITNLPNDKNFMPNETIFKNINNNVKDIDILSNKDQVKNLKVVELKDKIDTSFFNSLHDCKNKAVANIQPILDCIQINHTDIPIDKAINIDNIKIIPKIQNCLNPIDNFYCESNTYKKPTLTDNVENVRKYSFNQSEILKIYTKNAAKQEVQIISKLNVNFDFSEIVLNKSEHTSSCTLNAINEQTDEKILQLPAFSLEQGQLTNRNTNCFHSATLENTTYNSEEHKLSPECMHNSFYNYDTKTTVRDNCIEKNFKHNERTSNINIDHTQILLQDEAEKYDDEEVKLEDEDTILTLKNNIANDKDNNVKDILKKYSNIIKKKENSCESKRLDCTLLNSKTKETVTKCTRKYKIRDLDKLELVLPESLIVEKDRSVFPKANTQICNMIENTNSEDGYENQILNNDINKTVYLDIGNIISNDEVYVEEVSPEIIVSEPLLSPFNSSSENNTNQAILNPKTLLEFLNKEVNDDIIAPPSEFRDDNFTHYCSGQQELNIENTYENYKKLYVQNEPKINETSNVFENNFLIDLTPTSDTESCTFSQKENNYNLPTSSKSCSKLPRRHDKTDYKTILFNSRQAKLSCFKFGPKNILKK